MNSHCELLDDDPLSSNGNVLIGCDVVCSPQCEDMEWDRMTNTTSTHQMSHKRHEHETQEALPQQLYELKQPFLHTLLSTSTDDDNLSGRSSLSSCSSDCNTMSCSSSSIKKPRTKLGEKLKLIAHYLDTMSNIQEQRTLRRKQRMDPVRVHAHKSAPDVLHHLRYTRRPAPTRSFTIQSTSTTTTQPVSLPWEMICPDAIEIEEVEIEEETKPTERLIHHLCEVCQVPLTNLNTIVTMLTTQFGTVALDMTLFDILVNQNSVVFIGVLVFQTIDPKEECISYSSSSFIQFLKHIQELYEASNPFHNSCHAADVLHSLFLLLSTSPIRHRITFHRRIAALLAAVLHDVGHNGFTNHFLIQSKHAIALQYKDSEAPMEGMHADIAVKVLLIPSFGIFSKVSSTQQEEMIEVVRATIRSTALVYQKELIYELNQATMNQLWTLKEGEKEEEYLKDSLQVLILRGILHVSDISQTMKPFLIHNKWVTRLNNEMFQQGEADDRLQLSISPSYCFRRNWTQVSFLSSQIWFLENFAVPAVTALQEIQGMNVDLFVHSLQENIVEWRRQLETLARIE